MFLYSIFVNVETYYENTKFIAVISSVIAVLNIVLNYFGIKMFGYTACAYTTLLCYILFAAGHFVAMKLIARNNGVIVFDKKNLLYISAFVTISILASLCIYMHRYIRISFAVIISTIMLLNYRRIVKIYKTFSN
jgi:O-antigen/teichoic acid export membrane protein